MVLASVDESWSYGGSIITFLVPMLTFVAVAIALLVLYTKPQLIPGRPAPEGEAPVGATRVPGLPTPAEEAAEGPGDGANVGTGKPAEAASAE